MTTDQRAIAQAMQDVAEGRNQPALPILMRAVADAPGDAGLRVALGIALAGERQFDAAAVQFLKASRARPAAIEPRRLLADALANAGKAEAAIDVLTQTARDFIDDPAILIHKGALERAAGRLDAAEMSFATAASLKPDDAEIFNNLGVVARARGRTADAIKHYRQALALGPPSSALLGNIANALDELGDHASAERFLRQALDLDPTAIDARYNLAAHLTRRQYPDEAAPHLRAVVTEAPERWDAWINLGVAELALGDLSAAENAVRRALTLKPDNPEAQYDLAWVLLLSGRWQDGWPMLEARWHLPRFASRRPGTGAPEWDGQPLGEGTLLIYAEQGFGDSIQMIRFAALAKQRCRRVAVLCPEPLRRVVARAPGVDIVVMAADQAAPITAQVAMMSLPGLFGVTPETVPSSVGYLTPPPIPANLRLPSTGRRRIGIAWAGSPDNRIDSIRTCDASYFAQLLTGFDVDVVNFQVGRRAGDYASIGGRPPIFSCDGVVRDFDDTAAVVAQLDLIITVDTAVAHLAGALGKPTWMLVPFSPDYRWLMGRPETPWYSSLRLWRQRKRGDWNQVFAELAAALTRW